MATKIFGQNYSNVIGICQNESVMGMPIDQNSLYDDGTDEPEYFGFTMNEGTVAFVVNKETITGIQIAGPNSQS